MRWSSSTVVSLYGWARSVWMSWRGWWWRSGDEPADADVAAGGEAAARDESRGRAQGNQRAVGTGAFAILDGPAVGNTVCVFHEARRHRARFVLGSRRLCAHDEALGEGLF